MHSDFITFFSNLVLSEVNENGGYMGEKKLLLV